MSWRRTLSEYALFVCSYLVQELWYARKPIPPDVHSILFVKLDHLGDLLLSLPVLMTLRESYPKARLTVLAGKWAVKPLGNHPAVDEVIGYDAPFFVRGGSPTPWLERLELLVELKRRRFDLLVDLRGSWLTQLYAAWRGPRMRLDRASRNVSWRFQRAAPRHELERNLAVISGIGSPSGSPSWPLPATEVYWAWNFLASHGINLSRPVIAIHPGSPVELKRWPPERFAELGRQLVQERNAQVLVVGAAVESHLAAEIVKNIGEGAWNLAGTTDLLQLLGVLKNCTAFVGNDSGPMHLSAVAGIPTVGLFGPSDPTRFGPIGEHVRWVRAPGGCPPCMSETCKRGGVSCIERIEVHEVRQALDQLFSTPFSSGRGE